MAFDTNSNGSIEDDEIIEIEPRINDFAYTAGNPFDYTEPNCDNLEDSSIPQAPPGCLNPEGSYRRDRIDDFANTAIGPYYHTDNTPKTYQPKYEGESVEKNVSKGSFWSKIFRKKNIEIVEEKVYSSIFAPAEVRQKSHMLVQVYLHLFEETEMVKALAQESDKDAERRGYISLECKLKKGDKVDVLLNIFGETLLMSDKKSVVWQGSFTKCSFDYFVPKDVDLDELCGIAVCQWSTCWRNAIYHENCRITKTTES